MLSVDQFLRLIGQQTAVLAFLVASQIWGGVFSRPVPIQMESE